MKESENSLKPVKILRTDLTFGMIKPDLMHDWDVVFNLIKFANLEIVVYKQITLMPENVAFIYCEQVGKPFYQEMENFLCSGSVMPFLIKGKDALAIYKKLLGATNPKEAADNTIRKNFGKDMTRNGAHGADSSENAWREGNYFFPKEAKQLWLSPIAA